MRVRPVPGFIYISNILPFKYSLILIRICVKFKKGELFISFIIWRGASLITIGSLERGLA